MAAKASVSEVRAWAKENGFEISDRGRLPAEVWAAWEARTHASTAMPTPRPETNPEPVPTDDNELNTARARIEALEDQIATLSARVDAIEARSVERRRRFVRAR